MKDADIGIFIRPNGIVCEDPTEFAYTESFDLCRKELLPKATEKGYRLSLISSEDGRYFEVVLGSPKTPSYHIVIDADPAVALCLAIKKMIKACPGSTPDST